MTAAAILERARADGVTLALDPAGNLKATGEQAAVARWLPEIRERKAELMCLLSEADQARHLWLLELPTGERFSSSFTPPQTKAEVRQWHPDAIDIQLEDDR